MIRPPAVAVPGATRGLPASLLMLLLVVVPSCVTTYEPIALNSEIKNAPVAVPVTIPIPALANGESKLLIDYYHGILRRLQTAADDGDIAMIDALIESHDRQNLPEALKQHLQGYHGIARGIEFQKRIAGTARLSLRADAGEAPERAPYLGTALQLQMRLPAGETDVRLGGANDEDPVGFSVAVSIDDEYADGGTRSSQIPHFIWLPRTFDLAGDAVLTLPIDIDAEAGDAVRRRVTVHVDLMPGYVRYGDVRAPVHRVAVGSGEWVQWPKGYEIIAKTPLKALRTALLAFTPNNYASAYLAALLVPDEQRRDANALLIDQVRFGRVDQAQVAMAALKRTTDAGLPIGDRDAWLAWWQRQSR